MNITFNVNLNFASLMSFIIKEIIVNEHLSIYALSHFSIITKPVEVLKNINFPLKSGSRTNFKT